MVDYKEMIVYLIIAIVVIVAVALFLGKDLLAPNYNVSVSLYGVGSNPTYPYQTSHFAINITNHGSSPISNLLLGFYLDGSQISTNSLSIPAGESIVLLRNYTYPSPGTYDFQAVADPGHVLEISNRNATQSSLSYNILQTETANPYSSMPNNNITATQSFTLSGTGLISSAAVASKYNITLFNQLFGPGGTLPLKIVEDLYGYVAYSNGAYATYSNKSAAYTNWLQGTVDPQLVNLVTSSFGIKTREESDNVSYSMLTNTTSMCVFYSKGWTKIISYYNNSNGTTCLNLSSNNYSSTESLVFINLLKNNSKLTHYQSGFIYNNSTTAGTVLDYSKNNLTVTNIFFNKYGLFLSSILQLNKTRNVTAVNYTCNGLIYNSSNISVCSYIIPPSVGNVSETYGLVNSTYIVPHYIFSMYSLVNETDLTLAHDNAAHLMSSLDVNETPAEWQSAYKTTCTLENQSIGCKFLSFSYTDNATLNITNHLYGPITLNQLNCEIAPGFKNATVNKTIAQNSTLELQTHCNLIAVPLSSEISSYNLIFNYTYRNSTHILLGFLNVSDQ